MILNRRAFIGTAACFGAGCGQASDRRNPPIADNREFEAIRRTLGEGGRLGVFAIDTATRRRIEFDAHSRYAMCSTFKLPLAAFILWLSDRGRLNLAEQLHFGATDPLENSPVVDARLRRGSLPIGTLAAAVVQQSDNSAANLLLRKTGGPAALTRFIRACGDRVTRVDRYELALNSNDPGDPRDTTTPAALAELTRVLLFSELLARPSRQKLSEWLIASIPKPDRLRAGFPADWLVGHKPGTGRGGAVNDIAVAWPPNRRPIIVASFISGGNAGRGARSAAHRSVAAVIMKRFA